MNETDLLTVHFSLLKAQFVSSPFKVFAMSAHIRAVSLSGLVEPRHSFGAMMAAAPFISPKTTTTKTTTKTG